MVSARLLLVFLFALTACRAGPPPDIRFDAEEAAFIRKPGTTTIKGEAFLPDETGEVNVRYAAGQIIRLVPATAYARARYAYTFEGSKFVRAINIPNLDADPDYAAHTRVTKADPRGHFTFENVPPGDYFLVSEVIWKPKKSFFSDGGLIYDEQINWFINLYLLTFFIPFAYRLYISLYILAVALSSSPSRPTKLIPREILSLSLMPAQSEEIRAFAAIAMD